jgi:uncharacterized membrane protein (UPF0127 family)
VVNRTRDRPLGDRVALADGFFTRLRGLLGRPEPREGEGLLILPSAGVHMYGMRYPLDVLLLDRQGMVVATYPGLAPWSRTRMHRGARVALELPVGKIGESGTVEGDLLEWSGRKNAD